MNKIIILLSFLTLAGCEFAVDDKTAPQITLKGDSEVLLDLGIATSQINYYLEERTSYLVEDNVPGEILHSTPAIKNSDGESVTEISPIIKNTYTITYTVEDAAGNKATTTRVLIIKDNKIPVITLPMLHDVTVSGALPVSSDSYSIKFPANVDFVYDDLLTDVETLDVFYQVNGIDVVNPSAPSLELDISASPRARDGEGIYYFIDNGLYNAEYISTDDSFNVATVNRAMVVGQDVTPPTIISYPPLIIAPLTNMGSETEVSVDDFALEELKRKLTTEGIQVTDDYYPYSAFKSYIDENPADFKTEVKILETNSIFTANFTPEILTAATAPEGVDIPMVAIDVSGNGNSENYLIKRKLIIQEDLGTEDLVPPVLTLMGDDTVTINLGSPSSEIDYYLTPGTSYTVTDNRPGDILHITPSIKNSEGETVTSISSIIKNTYTITYSVKDAAGNLTSGQREIEIKDAQAPIITLPVLHDVTAYGALPVADDSYSIKFPANVDFVYDDLLFEVSTFDSLYQVNGINSINPLSPSLELDISASPRARDGEGIYYFIDNGLYNAEYISTDDSFNVATVNRAMVVGQDVTPPTIISYPPLIIAPLTNQGSEDNILVDDFALEELKRKLTTEGIQVADDYYPYSAFKSYIDENPADFKTEVKILETNSIFTANFTPEILTAATAPEGVDIPMVAIDVSGNGNNEIYLIKRKLIIQEDLGTEDLVPPVITLIGDNLVSINLGSPSSEIDYYLTPGTSYTVTDNRPGDILHLSPTITNGQGEEVAGISPIINATYTLTYVVSDIAGNQTSKDRTIEIRDMQAPIIALPVLHDVTVNGALPVESDIYSIKFPINVDFMTEDLLFAVDAFDVLYQVNGINSLNPENPSLELNISAAPRLRAELGEEAEGAGNVYYFVDTGLYTAEYTSSDDSSNVTKINRAMVVAQDVTPPTIISYPPLIISPLANIGDDLAIIIDEEELSALKARLTTEGIQVVDDFYPYNSFKSYMEDSSNDLKIEVKILEANAIFTGSFTPETLTAATAPEGVDIPMVAIDVSGNGDSAVYLIKRKLIIQDLNPPVLDKFTATPLYLDLDATLTSSGITDKIIALSSDPTNLDYVSFIDYEVGQVELLLEGIFDANGANIFLEDGSLSVDAMALEQPLSIIYTAKDAVSYTETPSIHRTKTLILQDTVDPILLMPVFETSTNNFLSIIETDVTTYINDIKQGLIDLNHITISDNSTTLVGDLELTAIVQASNNLTCYPDIGGSQAINLDLSCSGNHQVILILTDQSGNSTQYENEISIYIYDEESLAAFNEIVSLSTEDEFGNRYASFTDQSYTGQDLSTLINDIENTTLNTLFTGYQDNFRFPVIPTTVYTDQSATDHTVTLDFSNVSGDFVNFYTALNGDEYLSFVRPSPLMRYINPMTGIEDIADEDGSYTSLLSVKVSIGTYAELIKIPVKISPFENYKQTLSIIIPIYPNYVPNEEDMVTLNVAPKLFDSQSDLLNKNLIQDVSKFMNANTGGLYKVLPAFQDPNNNVMKPGISIMTADNSFKYNDIDYVEYVLDSEGNIKFTYQEQIRDHIQLLFETNTGLISKIQDLYVDGKIDPLELKISVLVLDPDLERTQISNAVIPLSSTTAVATQYTETTLSEANGDCSDSETYLYRGARDYVELDTVCNVDDVAFVVDANDIERTGEEGEYGYSATSSTASIWVTKIVTTAEGEEIFIGWCPVVNASCTPTSDLETKRIIIPYVHNSELYSPGVEVPSPLREALSDAVGGTLDFDSGVILTGFTETADHISLGEYLSKYIFNDRIDELNYQNKLLSKTSEPSALILLASNSPYSFFEEKFSFTTQGFHKSANGYLGGNPGNLSAYDKVISSSIQPTELSYYDIKNNHKVYDYNLATQSEADNNQQVLILKIEPDTVLPNADQNEWFLIEKRKRIDFDDITDAQMILPNGDKVPWPQEEEGIIVWHVENELNGVTVQKEGGSGIVLSAGFVMEPTCKDCTGNNGIHTNTNDGDPTGLIIKITDDLHLKICHISTGDISSVDADFYDPDCTTE